MVNKGVIGSGCLTHIWECELQEGAKTKPWPDEAGPGRAGGGVDIPEKFL